MNCVMDRMDHWSFYCCWNHYRSPCNLVHPCTSKEAETRKKEEVKLSMAGSTDSDNDSSLLVCGILHFDISY